MKGPNDKDVKVNGKWFRVTIGVNGSAIQVQSQYTVPHRGGLKAWRTIWHRDSEKKPGELAYMASLAASSTGKEDVITTAFAKKVAAKLGATLEWDPQQQTWFVANDKPDADTNYTYIGGWPLISESTFVEIYVKRCLSGK